MSDRLDLVVTDWLRTDAPAQASPQVLSGALERVATAGQERYLTQRVLGDRIGRRRDVRAALVLALIILATVGALAIAGALLRQPEPLPTGPLRNGSIVFRANSEAGDDLTGTVENARNGDLDLYAVDPKGAIRRVVGDDSDEIYQSCSAVSPDGSHLAYEALDARTLTPTLAPVPEGQAFGPAPSYAGPVVSGINVVALDRSGAPIGDVRQIALPNGAESTIECARWSPDSSKFAFAIDAPEADRSELWVVSEDGAPKQLDERFHVSGGWSNIAWSPDGSSLVVATGDNVHILPTDGGPARQLLPRRAESVAWSPDGSRIAVKAGPSLVVVSPEGRELFRRQVSEADSPLAWSPDGSWFAMASDAEVHLESPDGARSETIDVDVAGLFPEVRPDELTPGEAFTPTVGLLAWSPDSKDLLLTASPAFDINALITLAASGEEDPVVRTPPTIALRGMRAGQATWQGVHE